MLAQGTGPAQWAARLGRMGKGGEGALSQNKREPGLENGGDEERGAQQEVEGLCQAVAQRRGSPDPTGGGKKYRTEDNRERKRCGSMRKEGGDRKKATVEENAGNAWFARIEIKIAQSPCISPMKVNPPPQEKTPNTDTSFIFIFHQTCMSSLTLYGVWLGYVNICGVAPFSFTNN